MTTQLADMEVLKEIPGYKAIMKAVLKTQIQLLVEQLCNHTGEESIILTASVNDGSLSHLGSDLGKGFLDGREEIKSQFLGYCLKGHHKKKTQETEQPYQRSNISQPSPRTPLQQQTQKRSRIHPVSLSKAPQTHQYPASDNSFVPPAAKRQFRERNRSQEQVSDIALQGAQSVQQSPSVSPIVKQESQDNENDQTGRNVDSNFTSQPLPASLHISHTQTSGDPGYSDTSHSEDTANTDSAIGTGTSIKIEPVTEAELDLEITGVEMGEGAAANWGQNVSGPVDYGSSDAGDSSFDQPGNQSGYEPYPVYLSKSLPAGVPPSYQSKIRRPNMSLGSKRGRRSGRGRGRGKYMVSSQPVSSTVSHIPRGYKECEMCGKVLKKVSMFQHRQVHLGIKNHECDFCGKKFTQKATLDVHRRIHTGEKPYSCRFCGKPFSSNSGLVQHSRRCSGTQVVYSDYDDTTQ